MAELLHKTELIIWDEAPAMGRFCYEALDRTLQDVMKNKSVFGGIPFVLGGDWRQILPVLVGKQRRAIVDNTLKCSLLWNKVETISLVKNRRVADSKDPAENEKRQRFKDYLLEIGRGRNTHHYIPKEYEENCVDIDDIDGLIEQVYPKFETQHLNIDWLCERAILAPKNCTVDEINEKMLDLMPNKGENEEATYLSLDKAIDTLNPESYTVSSLNSLKLSGLPNHEIR